MSRSDRDLMSVKEVAARSGLARKSLYNQHSAGSEPFGKLLFRVGGRLVMTSADYAEWLKSQHRLARPNDRA
jgi:hypothetical protein